MKDLEIKAKEYHSSFPAGKIGLKPTKAATSQEDLSLAYTPGVAVPCMEIAANKENAYKYTNKGNVVAVVSNGTAVLGLGDIGAMASKPVMEGKGLLFKVLSGIDGIDIELDTKDVDEFCRTVKNIAPSFGGINLEDIKAPECFIIEERLKKELDIPVMHDDQHGTAIISAAAILNALEISGKDIAKVKMVINGAGSAAIAGAKLYLSLGLSRDNLIMCDSRGVLSTSRTDLNEYKKDFAVDTDKKTLSDAIVGADVFVGFSKADVLTAEMLLSMSEKPIVMAMANPNPEISYDLAKKTNPNAILATGRSDYPNQVNNVLGFPYIFRGALDTRATIINEDMKRAAVYAIAALAKEEVPEAVLKAYNVESLSFGPEYILPKPLDSRLYERVSVAVAKAAVQTGVARANITDWEEYKESLKRWK